jgi:hypothetical protein
VKNKYYELTRRLSELEIERNKVEYAVKHAESELRNLVKIIDGRSKSSTYFYYNGRTIRCQPCWRYKGRYNIFENGKRTHQDYLWGLHDIRLQFALGRI